MTAVAGATCTLLDSDNEPWTKIALTSVVAAEPAKARKPKAAKQVGIKIAMPATMMTRIEKFLKAKEPVKGVAINNLLEMFTGKVKEVTGIHYNLDIVNGENGPYVDAYLKDTTGEAVAEGKPRLTLTEPISIVHEGTEFVFTIEKTA